MFNSSEDDWMNNNKHNALINLIKRKLNLLTIIIDINNCSIKQNISNNKANKFLKTYLIDSYTIQPLDNLIGIYHNNELIQLIIFTVSDYIVEVKVICTKNDYIINDNISSICEYLTQTYKHKQITISYNADYTSINDKELIINGFMLSDISEPNCWYIKNITRIKNEIPNSYKLYDSGILTFMKSNNSSDVN